MVSDRRASAKKLGLDKFTNLGIATRRPSGTTARALTSENGGDSLVADLEGLGYP